MANDPNKGQRGPGELPQHPHVERMKPDPARPPKKHLVLVGLPGKSDRPGYQRLYLTAKLDYYAEFAAADILDAEAVPPERSPLAGSEATEVTLRRDATIQYVWSQSAEQLDDFDLDIRLGTAGSPAGMGGMATMVATCFPDGTCKCVTYPCHPTFVETACGCKPTYVATCYGTCATCETHCEASCAGTCITCAGTCVTCITCAGTCYETCVQTCAGTCAQTCAATCAQTCAQTCANCRPTIAETCAYTCHGTCATCAPPGLHCRLPQ